MKLTTIKGRFREVQATLQLDEADPSRSSVETVVEVASIDTNAAGRDAHLRSDDFFNAEKHPQITFRSTRVEPAGDGRWNTVGDPTTRDLTRSVTLVTEFEGRIVDPCEERPRRLQRRDYDQPQGLQRPLESAAGDGRRRGRRYGQDQPAHRGHT
jgi:polyisoprenoid-binding protein YceI